jgi:hypothetical protein
MHKQAEQCEIKASTLPGLICTAHLIIFTFQYEIINRAFGLAVHAKYVRVCQHFDVTDPTSLLDCVFTYNM